MNKTTITIIVAAAVGVINSLIPFLNPDLAALLSAVVGAVVIYFHLNAVKQAGLGGK